MNYCEKCYCATELPVCPACGSKRLRTAEEGDFCLLTAGEGSVLESLTYAFMEEGVPYSTVPYGGGVETKFALPPKNAKIFVPCGSLETAKKILTEMERAQTDELKDYLLENADKLNFSRRTEKKACKKLRVGDGGGLAEYCLGVIKSAEKITDGGAVGYDAERNGRYVFCYGTATLAINSKTFEVLSVTVNK